MKNDGRESRVILPVLSARYNTEAAEEYGPRCYLVKTENFSPFNTDLLSQLFARELRAMRFDPDRDYVVLTGPTVVLAVFLAMVVSEYGRARTLMFDARNARYVERLIAAGVRAPQLGAETG